MTGGGAYPIIVMACWIYSIGAVIVDILSTIVSIFVTMITMILAVVGTLVQVILPGPRYLPCTNLSPFSLSWWFPLGQPPLFSSFPVPPIQPFTVPSISPLGDWLGYNWSFLLPSFPTITKKKVFVGISVILAAIVMDLGWIYTRSPSLPIQVEDHQLLNVTITFISEMQKLNDIYRQKLHLMNVKHKKKMTWDEFKDPTPKSVIHTTSSFVNDTAYSGFLDPTIGLHNPSGQFYMATTIFFYITFVMIVSFIIGGCCRVMERLYETIDSETLQNTQTSQTMPSLFSLLARDGPSSSSIIAHRQKKKLKQLPLKKSRTSVIETPKTNKVLKEHLECTLCYQNIRNAALLCGHVGCQACLEKVRKGDDGAKCPWCREPFVTYIKLYV